MKKFIPSVLAFSVGVLGIFAFKPAPANKVAKNTLQKWTIDNTQVPPCVQAQCTNTVKTNLCGISGLVFSDNTCQTTEANYIYRP